jgi:TonB family protein
VPGGARSLGTRQGTPPGLEVAPPSGLPGLMAVPDTPSARQTTPGPSLREMSEASAQRVVKQRGPQHAPGGSAEERLAETLARGTGALSVQRSGFWDAYFTLLRKALLKAWVGEQLERRFDDKAMTRVRLVLDADGLLRDFDIITESGNKKLDTEVVQALHQTTQFPAPPDHVLHGRVELVTEWELTVHPGLAPAQGTPTFGPFGPALIFDVVTVVNPRVDLRPLEFNVALASYWTR